MNRRIILIVCEGTNTEPDYFGRIQRAIDIALKRVSFEEEYTSPFIINVVNKDDVFDRIDIETSEKEVVQKKPKGMKKTNPNARALTKDTLRELLTEVYGAKEGEEEYNDVKAMPLRFVALADVKNEQEGGLYDKVWAVFDKNGHTAHKKAFERAASSGVQIAFSCRSFEYWILLHFERTQQVFNQTVCKENECGLDGNNCDGKKCLIGYIRNHTVLKKYEKSNDAKDLTEMMSILLSEKHLKNAFENAAWLRYKMREIYPTQPIYDLDPTNVYQPWTDVDILVKSLLGIQTRYTWTELGLKTNFAGMKDVQIDKIDNCTLIFSAKDISCNPYTCKMYLKNKERDIIPLTLDNIGFEEIRKNNHFKITSSKPIHAVDFCMEIGNDILLIEF